MNKILFGLLMMGFGFSTANAADINLRDGDAVSIAVQGCDISEYTSLEKVQLPSGLLNK